MGKIIIYNIVNGFTSNKKLSKRDFRMKLRFKKRVIEIERIPDTLSEFNEIVEDRTGVPRDRQKLLCRKAWKGNLKRVEDLKAGLEVLLIGTAVSKRTKEPLPKKQVVPSQDKK